VAFTKAAVIAAHRGFDQAHRVAGGPLDLILTKADRRLWFRDAAEGSVAP
jgi:hypothetical protein